MRIESGNFKPLSNDAKMVPVAGKNKTENVTTEKDVYKFQTSGLELNKLFELAKTATDSIRTDKMQQVNDREAAGVTITGKDIVSKILGEKINGKRDN